MAFIGIDLGTTNSAAAHYRAKAPRMLRDKQGEEVVPSIVAIDDHRRLVIGKDARGVLNTDPARAVEEVKREMGTPRQFPLGDQTYRAHEISAILLKHLKEGAEGMLGEPADRAVITVPANFPDPARVATMTAGEGAGFKVERIINEPTAAALAYGHAEGVDEETVLVYDLGGGTFDVSVVEYVGDALDVLASAGDRHLGGKDFDRAMYEALVVPRLRREYGLDVEPGTGGYYRLLWACEEAKKALSFADRATIAEPFFPSGRGPVNLNIDVTRSEFEELVGPLIDRTEQEIRRALKDAGLLNKGVDRVLLVGGSTRIPYVQRLVERITGVRPRMDVDPDRAVALGAAVQAAIIAGDADHIIMDVCPLSLGTAALEMIGQGVVLPGRYTEIVRPNTKQLKPKTEQFATVFDDQERVDFRVYQRDATSTSDNAEVGDEPNTAEGFTLLGRRAVPLPPGPAGQEIRATYVYNPNGIVDVTVEVGARKETFQVTAVQSEREQAASQAKMEVLWERSAHAEKVRATLRAAERKLDVGIGGTNRLELEALSSALKQAVVAGDETEMSRLEGLLTDLLFDIED